VLRNILSTVFLTAFLCGLVAAEEFDARVLNIENGKVTFQKIKKGVPAPPNEAMTLPVAENVKVLRALRNRRGSSLEAGDNLPGGLKHEQLRTMDPGGITSKIITDDAGQKIKEMWVFLRPIPRPPSPMALERPTVADGETDRDPLPPHAVARFGTHRFRNDGTIFASAVSPDGRILASAGVQSVRLWNAETGETLFYLARRGHQVLSLAFSPDGKRLAMYDLGMNVRIVSIETRKTVKEFEVKFTSTINIGSSYLSFLPGGNQLMVLDRREPIAHLVDVESGAKIRSFKSAGQQIYGSALSPDGQTLAVAEESGAVRLWDVATGRERFQFKKHTGRCDALSFSPDSKCVASGGSEAYLWDAATGKVLHPLAVRTTSPAGANAVAEAELAEARRAASYGMVRSLSFSPDGKQLIASHDAATILWDPATGKEMRHWPQAYGPAAFHVRFLPDSHTLITTDQAAFQFFDVNTGQPCRRYDGHDSEINTIAYSPDGKQIATAALSGSGSIRVWDTNSRRVVWQSGARTPGTHLLAFSPQGRLLAAASGPNIIVWDLKTGDQRLTIPGRTAYIAMAISRDGTRLASGSSDGTVRLFDLASGKELLNFRVAKQYVVAIAFSPDLRLAASFAALVRGPGQPEPTIQLWDLATGKEGKSFPGGESGIFRLAFGPNGRSLAATTGSRQVNLWEVATGQPRRDFALPSIPYSVAFSPDGRQLAVGELSQPVQRDSETSAPRVGIWAIDLAHEHPPTALPGQQSTINALSYSPDSRLLASASSDTTALLWDVAKLDAAVPAVPMTPESRSACWSDLASDAKQAYGSMWKLADDPGAVDFLREVLKPASMPPDAATMKRLLIDLDSNQFAVRSRANQQLAGLGPAVEGELRRAMAGTLSVEVRRRVEKLLQLVERQQVRGRRAVEVLEWINNPAARQLLEALAGGTPEASITQEARTSLSRPAVGNPPPSH
jgi:WD40 repeat protein